MTGEGVGERICRSCGLAVGSSRVCSVCGAILGGPDGEPIEGSPSLPAATQESAALNERKRGWPALTLAGCVAIGLGAAVLFLVAA